MLNSLILISSKRITKWISIGASLEKTEPFNTKLGPIMSNLANDKVSSNFYNSVLLPNDSPLYYSNFILNL